MAPKTEVLVTAPFGYAPLIRDLSTGQAVQVQIANRVCFASNGVVTVYNGVPTTPTGGDSSAALTGVPIVSSWYDPFAKPRAITNVSGVITVTGTTWVVIWGAVSASGDEYLPPVNPPSSNYGPGGWEIAGQCGESYYGMSAGPGGFSASMACSDPDGNGWRTDWSMGDGGLTMDGTSSSGTLAGIRLTGGSYTLGAGLPDGFSVTAPFGEESQYTRGGWLFPDKLQIGDFGDSGNTHHSIIDADGLSVTVDDVSGRYSLSLKTNGGVPTLVLATGDDVPTSVVSPINGLTFSGIADNVGYTPMGLQAPASATSVETKLAGIAYTGSGATWLLYYRDGDRYSFPLTAEVPGWPAL